MKNKRCEYSQLPASFANPQSAIANLQFSEEDFDARVVACRRCPRLVAWCEEVAKTPPRRYAGQEYWARPVPSFGAMSARVLAIGLAPGAHGSNRTGRMFTGDDSGKFLFASLFRTGFATQPVSTHRGDGLHLLDLRIAAALRCAPPGNKPLPQEIFNCRPFLLEELRLMSRLRVLVGLGKIGFDAAFDAAREANLTQLETRPKFSHGAEVSLSETMTLLGTFHPSRQNTFTGRLTPPMMDAVFARARVLAFDGKGA